MSGGNGLFGPPRGHPPDSCTGWAGGGVRAGSAGVQEGEGAGVPPRQASGATSSAVAAGFFGIRTVKVVSPGSLDTVMKP